MLLILSSGFSKSNFMEVSFFTKRNTYKMYFSMKNVVVFLCYLEVILIKILSRSVFEMKIFKVKSSFTGVDFLQRKRSLWFWRALEARSPHENFVIKWLKLILINKNVYLIDISGIWHSVVGITNI